MASKAVSQHTLSHMAKPTAIEAQTMARNAPKTLRSMPAATSQGESLGQNAAPKAGVAIPHVGQPATDQPAKRRIRVVLWTNPNLRSKMWYVEKRYHDESQPILVSDRAKGGMTRARAEKVMKDQAMTVVEAGRKATLSLVLCDAHESVLKREKGVVVAPPQPELWGVMCGDKLVLDPRGMTEDHWSRFTTGQAAIRYARSKLRNLKSDELQPVRVR